MATSIKIEDLVKSKPSPLGYEPRLLSTRYSDQDVEPKPVIIAFFKLESVRFGAYKPEANLNHQFYEGLNLNR